MPNQEQKSATGGDSDCCQLKAGHPPAVKVGNMRVTQRSHSISSNHSDKNDTEDKTDTSVPKVCSFAPKTDVKESTGGLPDKIAHNVVAEAVKHFHEKPTPTHDNRGHGGKPNVIQQPKK